MLNGSRLRNVQTPSMVSSSRVCVEGVDGVSGDGREVHSERLAELAHDGDWASSMVRTLLADGAEHESFEATKSPGTNN